MVSKENGLNDYYFKSMVDMYEHSEYFSEEYLIMEKEILESAFMDEYTTDNKICEKWRNDMAKVLRNVRYVWRR